MFGKGMMKNAHLLKMSILLQFGGEILVFLCVTVEVLCTTMPQVCNFSMCFSMPPF